MKIICTVKFTPDVEALHFDGEKQELIREKIRQIINPDDACALGFALQIKKKYPDTTIEAVTMAPLSVLEEAKNIARRGFDTVTILTDPAFAQSDTLATSRVLGWYIRQQKADVILTGCRSIDGDTAHTPAELAAYLGIGCMSAITKLDEESFVFGRAVVEADTERDTQVFEISLPAVLGISEKSGIRLPFVRYANLDLDVTARLKVLDARDLSFPVEKAGTAGSATKVVKTYVQTFREKQERIFVKDDDAGVETVIRFLKEKGILP